jgi:hypothetical protein
MSTPQALAAMPGSVSQKEYVRFVADWLTRATVLTRNLT